MGGDRWRAALPGGQGGGEASVDEEGGDANENKAEDEAALAHCVRCFVVFSENAFKLTLLYSFKLLHGTSMTD